MRLRFPRKYGSIHNKKKLEISVAIPLNKQRKYRKLPLGKEENPYNAYLEKMSWEASVPPMSLCEE
jgi:hypothetical protein